MISAIEFVIILDSVFFVFYGIHCFISKKLASDFKRFKLPDSQRILTGMLQLFASVGLLIGFYIPIIGLLAAGGLGLMMLVAFIYRVKMHDSAVETAPSVLFMVLNFWIMIFYFDLLKVS